MTDESPWYASPRGQVVVVVYAVLTLLALVLSTGTGPAEALFFLNASGIDQPDKAIPPFVYLYAFLGAMAYAFTSVVAKFERDTQGVVRVGLRALAALPLAAGVFLLADALGLEAAPIAGVAFLVGLYVNLTLKALGGLAERLYGGSDDESGAEQGDDATDGDSNGDADEAAAGDADDGDSDGDSTDRAPDDGSDGDGPQPE